MLLVEEAQSLQQVGKAGARMVGHGPRRTGAAMHGAVQLGVRAGLVNHIKMKLGNWQSRSLQTHWMQRLFV